MSEQTHLAGIPASALILRQKAQEDLDALARRLAAIDASDSLISAVARDFGVRRTALVAAIEALRV